MSSVTVLDDLSSKQGKMEANRGIDYEEHRVLFAAAEQGRTDIINKAVEALIARRNVTGLPEPTLTHWNVFAYYIQYSSSILTINIIFTCPMFTANKRCDSM